MTTKKKTPPAKQNANELRIKRDSTESETRALAETSLSAEVLNSATARMFTKPIWGETDLTETVNAMRDKVNKVNAGDVSDLEATLTAQTVSLNAIFNELARRAAANMGEYINATETYMRLALKAQSQCARTIEVLAAMKNPPVIFAKQTNISHGNQQVNNGSNPNTTHTGKIINQPNELLEANHGKKTMDSRTTQTTISKDKAMATVAT